MKSYVKNVNIEPGFHQPVFDGLKTKVEVMMEKSRLSAIVFDEMAIEKHLSYDVSKDCIQVVEDLGFMGKPHKYCEPCQCFHGSRFGGQVKETFPVQA